VAVEFKVKILLIYKPKPALRKNARQVLFMFVTDYAVVICTALLYLQSICKVFALFQRCKNVAALSIPSGHGTGLLYKVP